MAFSAQESFFTSRRGFTLVEALVGSAVFLMVALSVYGGYAAIKKVTAAARFKVVAAALANEQLEIARNMPYADVGVEGSIPAGKIPHEQTLVRDGIPFAVTATVRNIDDPFDGTLGGSPNDTSPADYKLVEIGIACDTCTNFSPIRVTGHVAPKSLETASTNGALFIQVFDGSGQPVQGADVHVVNRAATSTITIDDVTNSDGILALVDVPPASNAYEITVSKDGYTSAQTYSPSEVANPLQPHATVILQAVTQVSFAIDKVSTINLSSVTPSCSPVANVDFSFAGSKLIGTTPNLLKHDYTLTTNSSGSYSSSTVEWDSYMITLAGPTYDIVGTNAVNPVLIAPDSTLDIEMILAPKSPKTLLVSVKDSGSGLPVSDANVTIENGTFTDTKVTGSGYIIQTDWSGGSGQSTSTDPLRYFTSDGGIETDLPSGELRLKNVLGSFEPAGVLESSTFDTGSVSNFHEIVWGPYDQDPAAGEGSVKFQIATNNDASTWNYEGPDGTASSYYDAGNRIISADHNGDRYVRYKVFLQTADSVTTPNVANVAFTFTSLCTPPGQSAWSGLSSGTSTITVAKDGYQIYEALYDITDDWTYYEVQLLP